MKRVHVKIDQLINEAESIRLQDIYENVDVTDVGTRVVYGSEHESLWFTGNIEPKIIEALNVYLDTLMSPENDEQRYRFEVKDDQGKTLLTRFLCSPLGNSLNTDLLRWWKETGAKLHSLAQMRGMKRSYRLARILTQNVGRGMCFG